VPGSPLRLLYEHFLTSLDGEAHARARGLVQKSFSPCTLAHFAEHITSEVTDRIATAKSAGRFDAVADLAGPLPASVISAMFGVPFADRARFASWIHDVLAGVDPGRSAEVSARADAAASAYFDYMKQLVAERRAEPRADLVSELIALQESGEQMSDDELLGVLAHIFAAAIETSTGSIGALFRVLAEHPDQLALLRADATLIPRAIEEVLRFAPPVRVSPMRVCVNGTEVGGRTIEPGGLFSVWINAANRDPDAFADPDTFDVRRNPNPHLSFSRGVNFCLGAHLARLEAKLLLEITLRELTELYVPPQPLVYRDRVNVHVLRSLEVVCA
jgi:cytochrome P450